MNFKWMNIFVVILYADQNFVTEGRCTNGEVSPDPSDKTCKRYFLCNNGYLVAQQCLNNFVYSKTTRTCVPTSSAYNDCNNFTTRRPMSTTFKIYPRCTEGETRSHPHDCRLYYVCSHNVWVPKICPHNNVYSKTVRKCVLWHSPYDDCSKTYSMTTTPVNPTTRYTTTTYKHQRCKEGETRPHYRDCKSYFICIYNVWNPRTCPKNYVYSKTVGKCVMSHSPYDYCSKTTYKMTPTTTVFTTTRYFTKCNDGETRPHPYDCRLYYVCSYNVWIPKECPHRNVYSKTVGKCVMSHSPYDYCSIYTPTRFRTTTRKYHPKCKEGETRPHPKDCKLYYVCSYYAWVPKVCPHKNVYSKTVGKCVMSYSPYDHCSKIPDNNEPTSSTESCISGETYPARDNCFRYYYCSNGTLQQRTCVFDFVYSRRIKRCVPRYSKHADCKA